jgi:LysR family transcriptional regulator, glycine cleavage system transcriptional activator
LKEREIPLTALRAFAVAARSQSLMAAAQQLGVTHGAVSKQIIALEAWLGQGLFTRDGRSLRLTPYGHILADRVAESMSDLGAACEYVRKDRARRVISIESPATFAMYFLLPNLKEFEASSPGISVWISTRMTNQAPDFARHDIVITRGAERSTNRRKTASRILFTEELTVVSAKSLLRDFPVMTPADVCHHRPISSSSRPGDWDAWLARAGLPGQAAMGGHQFDHLFVALHAVRDGIGSTIAPLLLFDRPENAYGLTCPLPDIVIPGQSYHAHVTAPAESAGVDRLLAWLERKCSPGRLIDDGRDLTT